MPHTSHKKKSQHQHQHQPPLSRNKRGEIESDDGWTRIARSDKAFTINTRCRGEVFASMAMRPDDPNYDRDLDEGDTRMIIPSTPAETPDGASLEQALTYYQKCEATWKESNTWAELKNTFEQRILKEDLNITNCICFGLSSLTGFRHPGVDRRDVAVYQLASFKSVIDILTDKQDQRPAAFAQEPMFNTLDVALLAHLNIKVVEHPEAFNLITLNTFTFCPGAEQFVVRGTLIRSPAIHMGSGALETYRDPETGDLRSPAMRIELIFHVDEDKSRLEGLDGMDHAEERKELCRRENGETDEKFRVERMKGPNDDMVRGASILHHFKKGKESFRLPDLEGHNYALYDIHLFWRSSNAKEED